MASELATITCNGIRIGSNVIRMGLNGTQRTAKWHPKWLPSVQDQSQSRILTKRTRFTRQIEPESMNNPTKNECDFGYQKSLQKHV